MLIVDSHCHAGETWYEPIETLLYQLDVHEITKAVLVQHAGSYDNSYLLECASRFPNKFAVVALVDTSKTNPLQITEKLAEEGATAIRLKPNDRSPGSNPLAIWQKASDLNLVVSCIGEVKDFASNEFHKLVSELPDLKIVVEHMAGVGHHSKSPYDTFKKAMELAKFKNTYIKIGGLGEIYERPPFHTRTDVFKDTSPLINLAYNAFGSSRMMWGSDFPPVSNREGYKNALNGIMTHPIFQNIQDREWVMGKTAIDVFTFQ